MQKTITVFLSLLLTISLFTACGTDSMSYAPNTPAPTPTPITTTINKEETVYITGTGNKYHKENYRYLKYSRREATLEYAKRIGYSPCSVCH